MSRSNSKAGKLLGSLAATSVEEWDELLRKLGQDWMFAAANRQARARFEGVTYPPPPPPSLPDAFGVVQEGGPVVDTFNALLARYKTDENSPFHKLRFNTRVHYESQANRLSNEIGVTKLTEINEDSVEEKRQEWITLSGEPMANSLVSIFRIIVNYGAKVLKDKECQRLAGSIKGARIKNKPSKRTRITRAQANDLRAQARRRGRPSIALAQAFQFDCGLSAIDIIGQWVPISEIGSSEIASGSAKWIGGLRWNEIKDFVLTHAASRNQKEIKIDLRNCPMVMEELAKIENKPSTGAVIVCETTELPWIPGEFRRWWRKVAREVDIHDDVRFADSSSGEDETGDKITASEI